MAVESSIIFKIGTKSIGGFTELKSAIDLLGQAYTMIKEGSKALDEFSTMWQHTNQQAVMMADSAAGGLVDTTEIMRGYNKLMQSGAKITEQQFATLTARSAELAQVTGEDATDAFKELTEGIRTGSVDALKKYGIKLKETENLQEGQAKAIKAMTEGYEDLNVSAKTTTERMTALENNLGTITSLMYDALGSSEAFGDELDILNKALGEFATQLAESPKAMTDFMLSMDGMKQAAMEVGRSIVNTLAGPFLWIEEKILELGGIEGRGSLGQALDDMMKTTDAEQKRLDALYVAQGKEREQRKLEGIGKGAGPQRPGGRGRGGGAAKKSSVMQGGLFPGLDQQFTEKDPFFDPYAGTSTFEQQLGREFDEEVAEIQREQDIQHQERMAKFREKEKEDREALMEMREKEMEQAEEIAATWESTMDRVSNATAKQDKSISLLTKAIGTSMKAIQTEKEHTGAAVATGLSEVGSAISEEAGWQALMEIAKAIAAAASQNYVAAAAHGAAAVAFGVAAARAGSGGGSGGGSGRVKPPEQRFTGPTDATNFGGGQGQGGGEFTVNITMKEGAGGFFDAMVEENDRASIDGRRSFGPGRGAMGGR